MISVTPYMISVTPYMISLTPYMISVTPYMISVTPYMISVTPYMISVFFLQKFISGMTDESMDLKVSTPRKGPMDEEFVSSAVCERKHTFSIW